MKRRDLLKKFCMSAAVIRIPGLLMPIKPLLIPSDDESLIITGTNYHNGKFNIRPGGIAVPPCLEETARIALGLMVDEITGKGCSAVYSRMPPLHFQTEEYRPFFKEASPQKHVPGKGVPRT